jgi:peptidoglycan/LPS O-acetylase OafA/YrhL
VGVFLAATRDTWSAWSRSARIRLALAGACASLAALAAVGTAPAGPDLLWLYTVLAFGFGAVLVGSHGAPAPRLGAAWIRWVALLSYGGYLWNNLIARLFERSWRGPWALGALVFVAATFAVAWVTYTCVELPGMRLRRPLLSWLGADRDRFEGTRASDRPAVDPSSSS